MRWGLLLIFFLINSITVNYSISESLGSSYFSDTEVTKVFPSGKNLDKPEDRPGFYVHVSHPGRSVCSHPKLWDTVALPSVMGELLNIEHIFYICDPCVSQLLADSVLKKLK